MIELIEAFPTAYPEYVYRDHVTGKHYVHTCPTNPADIIVAFRYVTVTERRWWGEHPDAIATFAGSDEPPTSITITTEYGEWRHTP